MHFAAAATLALAGLAQAANTVTFWTLDDATRTVYFTGNSGVSEDLPSVQCSSQKNETVEFPEGWVGNFYAVREGDAVEPGMLGEVCFGAWGGLTYFDVSAIVNATDKDNVKQMWPARAGWPMSGCEVFPCDNAYYLPDDVQTKVTKESDLFTSLGSGSTGLAFAAAQQ